MFLIPLAGKSYKLEHNSRKMSQKVLKVYSSTKQNKKRVLKNYFRWDWDQKYLVLTSLFQTHISFNKTTLYSWASF